MPVARACAMRMERIYYIILYRKFSPVARLGGLAPARPTRSGPNLIKVAWCALKVLISEGGVEVLYKQIGNRSGIFRWVELSVINILSPEPTQLCHGNETR